MDKLGEAAKTGIFGMCENSGISSRLTLLLAFACSFILANLYYTQPIIATIAQDINLPESASGLIVTMAQLGYCSGVLFLVPLGDLVENRKLIIGQIFAASLALCAAGLSKSSGSFFFSIFLVGLCTSAVQVIVPYGAALAKPSEHGRVVGTIASGAILGIVLSRPAASFITNEFSWQACFLLPSVLMALLGLIFIRYLPSRFPYQCFSGRTLLAPGKAEYSYAGTLLSMGKLLASHRVLQARLLMMALVFSCFTIFWAAVPIVLKNELGYTHANIALFSLASLVAPVCVIIAGRLADKGFGFRLIILAFSMAGTAFLITPLLGLHAGLIVLSICLLDSGVHCSGLITQQTIISFNPKARGRLNALYISVLFCGGGAGSFLGPWLYSHYGWNITCAVGFGIILAAFIIHINVKQLKTSENYSQEKAN